MLDKTFPTARESSSPTPAPIPNRTDAFAQHHAHRVGSAGAQSHADSDFARAHRYVVGSHTVQSDRREQQRDNSEDGEDARARADHPEVEAALQ